MARNEAVKDFLNLVNIVPAARRADNRNKLRILTQRDSLSILVSHVTRSTFFAAPASNFHFMPFSHNTNSKYSWPLHVLLVSVCCRSESLSWNILASEYWNIFCVTFLWRKTGWMLGASVVWLINSLLIVALSYDLSQHIYSLHHGSLPQDITSEEDEQVKTATDDHHGHFLFAPSKLLQTTLIWNLVASLRFIVGIPLVTWLQIKLY